MDYHSIHGQDVSTFDLPSTHRLPTVSAAAALEELRSDPSCFVSTGLDSLDQALDDKADECGRDSSLPGGFQRGQVVEVWGPPGSGKTSFGMQLAANTLKNDSKVMWVDAFRPICGTRLQEMVEDEQASSSPVAIPPSELDRMPNFLHFVCPSLAHFIALLCRSTTTSVTPDTSLVVIDSLSALVNQTFPKTQENRRDAKGGTNTSARRLQVLQSVISNLQKLAATRDILVVLLTQCATKMQAERGATLIPAINATAWDQGIATRLVLFRDWLSRNDGISSVHFAGIQKLNGKTHSGGLGHVCAFELQAKGLISIDHDNNQHSLGLHSAHQKRKLGDTDFEVADSEDEDYGWEDEDAISVPMPPQWQGSEDLLLGQHDDDGNRLDEEGEAPDPDGETGRDEDEEDPDLK